MVPLRGMGEKSLRATVSRLTWPCGVTFRPSGEMGDARARANTWCTYEEFVRGSCLVGLHAPLIPMMFDYACIYAMLGALWNEILLSNNDKKFGLRIGSLGRRLRVCCLWRGGRWSGGSCAGCWMWMMRGWRAVWRRWSMIWRASGAGFGCSG